MDNTVLNTLVVASGVIIGAAFTAIASGYSSKQKIKEVEITYRQKLQENYLANARQQIKNVYAPLNIILSKLIDQYVDFSNVIDIDKGIADKIAEEKFQLSGREFLRDVKDLIDRGADAYLTNQLENYLRSFTSFIKESLKTDTPKLRVVPIYIGIASVFLSLSENQGMLLEGKRARILNKLGLSFNFLGYGISFKKELIAAPIISREFQEKITKDVYTLKLLIKEVTLGSQT